MATAHSYKVGVPGGPGRLTFGETGTENDFSCQVAECALNPDKDAEDAIKVLCGGSVPGAVTYTWALAGNFNQDLRTAGNPDAESGINIYCLQHAGEEVAFEFTPNSTESPGFSGMVTIDPIAIGGEVGSVAQAEFEFSVTGQPQIIPATP